MDLPNSTENEKTLQNSENMYQIFHCFICMERVNNAHMCPHCSKLCCFQCIRIWLTEKLQCPHCRHCIQLSDLVKCRWAEDFAKQLDDFKKLTISSKTTICDPCTEKSIIDLCSDHKENFNVFCWTCQFCICHQCALWSGKHSGHTFKPLDEIYDIYYNNIKQSLIGLRTRFMVLNSLSRERRKFVHNAIAEKAEVYRDLQAKVTNTIDKFEFRVENQIFELISQQVNTDNQIEKIDKLLSSIENSLHTISKTELIISSSSIENKISEALKYPIGEQNNTRIDFENEIVPNYESCTYILKKFSKLQRKGEAILSDPLHINGLCWRLKIYPDGNGIARGSYLSIFLELNYGPKGSLKYEYRIEMVNQMVSENFDNFVREFTSDYHVKESWGYNRFFRLDLLSTEGFLDVVNDSLTFRLYIRNPTYYEKCRDQSWFIEELMKIRRHKYANDVSEDKKQLKKPSKENDISSILNDLSSDDDEDEDEGVANNNDSSSNYEFYDRRFNRTISFDVNNQESFFEEPSREPIVVNSENTLSMLSCDNIASNFADNVNTTSKDDSNQLCNWPKGKEHVYQFMCAKCYEIIQNGGRVSSRYFNKI